MARVQSGRYDLSGNWMRQNPETLLREYVLANANADGGWAYYAGKSSRLEPTCWAVLALADSAASRANAFVAKCQQTTGWLVEDPHWPVNIGFNGLAAFTSWRSRGLA